eukprot:103894_1
MTVNPQVAEFWLSFQSTPIWQRVFEPMTNPHQVRLRSRERYHQWYYKFVSDFYDSMRGFVQSRSGAPISDGMWMNMKLEMNIEVGFVSPYTDDIAIVITFMG